MTMENLNDAVQAAKEKTRAALETVMAELNKGQRKKVCAVPAVAELLERYGVEVDV